jgi:hypothetical protein
LSVHAAVVTGERSSMIESPYRLSDLSNETITGSRPKSRAV